MNFKILVVEKVVEIFLNYLFYDKMTILVRDVSNNRHIVILYLFKHILAYDVSLFSIIGKYLIPYKSKHSDLKWNLSPCASIQPLFISNLVKL